MIAAEGTDRGPVPRLFVAVTRHLYVLPADSPLTVIGLFDPDLLFVTPPFVEEQVAVNFVIGAPLPDGAVNVTLSEPEPTLETVGFGGAPGAPTVIAPLEVDVALVPTEFRAATWNLYDAPLVSPVMVWVVAVELNTRGDWGEPALIGVTM